MGQKGLEWSGKGKVDCSIDKLESSAAWPLFDTRFAEEISASVRTLPEQGSQAENCGKQSGFLVAWGYFWVLCLFAFNNQRP